MDQLIQFIKDNGTQMMYSKNMNVFYIEESAEMVFYLEKGLVKIAQEAADGHTITLSLREEGDLFGLAEVLAQQEIRDRIATCLTEVVVYGLTSEQLYTFLQSHLEHYQLLSSLMAKRLIETQQYVRDLTGKTVPERLKWFLYRFMVDQKPYKVVELPLSHEEISYIIGCSRQKVTHYLNEWRKLGYITYGRGYIRIERDELFRLE